MGCAPAPNAYDAKIPVAKKSGLAVSTSRRFVDPKDETPGPGQYLTVPNKSVRASQAELSLKNKMSFLFKEKLKKNPTHDRDLDQEYQASSRAFTPVDDSLEFVDDTPPTVPTGNSIQQSP